MSQPLPIGVLLSGGGRSLKNLFEKIEAGKLSAKIEVVVGSKDSAFGLERARRRGCPTRVIRPGDFADVESFSAAITQELKEYDVRLVVMAGFMHLYQFPPEFEHRVINIHPALLPAFGGKGFYGHHVHEGVLEYGAKISGCTVHFADLAYDRGPIILQRAVPVLEDDDADILAARVFEEEKRALPEAVQLIAENRIEVHGRTVKILPPVLC